MEIKQTKGFTLIELLVVIGIVAILSAVVILTLNPAELLKQSRDSNRLSDMATLKSALSLYLADVITPSLGDSARCYVSNGQTLANISSTAAGCGLFAAGTYASTTELNLRKVDGTGWIPVNMTQISSGAPVGNLPVDPSNTSNLFYGYRASNTSTLTFEVDVARMESAKFASSSEQDGGNLLWAYEVGTDPALDL